jgi:predicted AlkP superfamily phosphohydrolase/phosphomutase
LGKTLFIGLDGAVFKVLDMLMDSGVMPGLKALSSSGSRAVLNSTSNPLTPPAWISLMTGREPGSHGIFDFLRPEEKDSGVVLKLNDSKDVKCETIWSIAGRQGKRVASFNFYGMSPAAEVNGYLVSGFIPWKHLKRATWPPQFYDVMKTIPGVDIKTLGFHLEQEKKCFQGGAMSADEASAWIRSHIERERNWFEIVRRVMVSDPCDLTAVVFDGVDKLQHLFWPYILGLEGFIGTPEKDAIRELCLDYFRKLDNIITGIVELAGPGASVFMASDHGFQTTDEIFYLNKWLNDNGLLHWSEPDSFAAPGQLTEGRISSHNGIFDYGRTVAYAWTPSSNGIYIRKAAEGKPGVSESEYHEVRERIRKGLYEFRDDKGGRPVSKVLTREEAFPGEYSDLAPDLTVLMRDGGMVSILNSDKALKPRTEPAGCHSLDGIFMAFGEGIKKGSFGPLKITDVAPALLYSLGLSVPEDLTGRVPSEIFTEERIKAAPVAVEGRTLSMGGQAEKKDDGESDVVMSQLKMLGYIE